MVRGKRLCSGAELEPYRIAEDRKSVSEVLLDQKAKKPVPFAKIVYALETKRGCSSECSLLHRLTIWDWSIKSTADADNHKAGVAQSLKCACSF